jgi:hypothetical protein
MSQSIYYVTGAHHEQITRANAQERLDRAEKDADGMLYTDSHNPNFFEIPFNYGSETIAVGKDVFPEFEVECATCFGIKLVKHTHSIDLQPLDAEWTVALT